MTPATDQGEPLRAEAADWLMRLQASPGDATVRAGLDAWLAVSCSHRQAWQSVERVWRVSGELPAMDGPTPGNITPAYIVALRRSRRPRRALGIAVAALAACLALYFAPVLKLACRPIT